MSSSSALKIGGLVHGRANTTKPLLNDQQRLDWLRLIRSENVGPRGIMAQTPEA